VSEIMLQQTQVTTAAPYFQRFMASFPDVVSLANASEDEILHHWTGLGYYNRARNLHKAARLIVDGHKSRFPDTQDALEALPGIGRSTAGAIQAIAFGRPAAILDGNVKRVLTRVFGIHGWPGEKAVEAELWALAEFYTPTERVADYTQAMMDIGATLCVRGQPRCAQCPLQKSCIAHAQGIEKTLPTKKVGKKIPVRAATFLILQNQHAGVLLEKRPSSGIWGGLWSLPEIPEVVSSAAIRAACLERFRMSCVSIRKGKNFRHTFSHFHLDILPVYIKVKTPAAKIMESDQQIWYKLRQPDAVGLPAPVKLLLEALMTEEV
jgi:A/G-specific adenine glycosylase